MKNAIIQTGYRAGSERKLFAVLLSTVLVFVFQAESQSSTQIHLSSLSIVHASAAIAVPLSEDVSETDDSDLFGSSGGYIHPYITIGAEFTDNLYNVNSNLPVELIKQANGDVLLQQSSDNPEGKQIGQISNILTRVSPGIWFSIPRTKQVPIAINTNNTTPGGLRYQLNEFEGSESYQAYGLVELDYKYYSADSRLNDTDAKAEGLFRYNMSNGLSLQVLDRFTYGQDQLEIGAIIRNDLRRFTSNVFIATADFDITEKLRVKLDYSNFLLQYDDEINNIFNRTDNVFDLYGFYKYSLKTSFFIEARITDVVYTTAEEKNNLQYYIYGGIKWDTTEKLALNAKIGNQTRNYFDEEVAGNFDWSGLTYELQALYRWSVKTDFALSLYGRNEESNSALAVDMRVLGVNLGYHQQFTEKLSGRLNLLYDNIIYNQVDNSTRDDKRYYFRPSLQYKFRDWALAELDYLYDTRDSSENLFDYTSNTVILNFKFAL